MHHTKFFTFDRLTTSGRQYLHFYRHWRHNIRRLVVMRSNSNAGNIFFYFILQKTKENRHCDRLIVVLLLLACCQAGSSQTSVPNVRGQFEFFEFSGHGFVGRKAQQLPCQLSPFFFAKHRNNKKLCLASKKKIGWLSGSCSTLATNCSIFCVVFCTESS